RARIDRPDPTVEVGQQWCLLIKKIPIRGLAFPNQPGRRGIQGFVSIDTAHLRVMHEPREVHEGHQADASEKQWTSLRTREGLLIDHQVTALIVVRELDSGG